MQSSKNNNTSGQGEGQVFVQEVVEAFRSLFRGRVDAFGSVEGRCNKEPVTLDHYRRHLKGEVSLGVYLLLDDGTCYFFTVDLDEKDFNKAKAIRQELVNNGIPAYIAESKSKGFHIYGFALQKFIARDIRRILHYILNKLNIKAEVFPKQDFVTEATPFGNYINLPCFGHTRPFLSGDLREVPLKIAINRIKYAREEAIERMLRTVPEAETNQKLGHALEEIVGMLQQPLGVGERRPTLIKLAGYLRYRGIPEEVAVVLLLPWAEKVFNEPLPPEEAERHIRGIYQRYGARERKVAKTHKRWHAEVPL